jgi:hypothetical protein
MRDGTDLLVEHYHKTFDVALLVWEQRNRTFLMLLAVVGAATLLTFDVPQAQPLMVDLVARLLSVENEQRRQELRASFPYGLLQTILLMVILYLTLILYHRTTFISRTYRYLESLEHEVREGLELSTESVAFSREGKFYWNCRPALASGVWFCFAVMLGTLLGSFLTFRILNDFMSGNSWVGFVDVLLAIPTLVFYFAYVFSSANSSFLRKFLTGK